MDTINAFGAAGGSRTVGDTTDYAHRNGQRAE
jgi:hypothetical protein